MRKSFIFLINLYQRYVSKFSSNSCRYYPSCSNYAKIQFDKNRMDKAIFFTIKRILTCNQLFAGGFDYPIVKLDLKINPLCLNQLYKNHFFIKYYLIPKDECSYYLIKRFKGKDFD